MSGNDPASLARLWPNRTHESNWLKQALCALGLHRWHRLEVPTSESTVDASFCRWCPEVKVHRLESPRGGL